MTEPPDTAMLRANAEWLLRNRGLDTSGASMEAAADEIDHLRSELAREYEINRGNGENAAWISMHEKVARLTKRAKKLRRQRDEARADYYETARALAAERGGIWRLPPGAPQSPAPTYPQMPTYPQFWCKADAQLRGEVITTNVAGGV